MKTEISVIHCK